MATVDLNADMGESFGSWQMGDDEALLGIVTSANVACGFHAGDAVVMGRTCTAAVEHGVCIGAHVSYRDLAGFGRNFVDVDPGRLRDEVIYQLSALRGVAEVHGAEVRYVKPHGALYNTIVHHEVQAKAVVEAISAVNAASSTDLALLGLPGALVLDLAEQQGIRTLREAFADRAYNPDGTLVPRRHEGSVLHNPDEVAERVVTLVTRGVVSAIDGTEVAIKADSVCVHGDTPGAVSMAAAVRDRLAAAGVELQAAA
ncbi:LamB/YcsF family protein [Cutibacterium sp. WCA-380-WT-3A]|uniref:5-oxoprolinase subunit A n=1 Tax=Cutibacterium porci TaxID=2605781 RepID=A0A7K0J4V2_9ACTN|nr:5-oxoprolinase subunit PxpA [Cutibacterium porci]MSS44971.1 LamB/YcsF family protein [Cutibacterium porci]